MVMLFPDNLDEARSTPSDAKGIQFCYVDSYGNRLGRAGCKVADLQAWGCKLVSYEMPATQVSTAAAGALFGVLVSIGHTGSDQSKMRAVRQGIEVLIGLPCAHRLEGETVPGPASVEARRGDA